MSLFTALHTASSSLGVLSAKSEVISRNVANASTPYATHKSVSTISDLYGVSLSPVARTTNESLYESVLGWTSSAAQQQAVVDGLETLNATIGDTADEQSPAALASKLQTALQTYSTSPTDLGATQAAVTAASTLASSLNGVSETIAKLQTDTEDEVSNSVDSVNSLISQFASVNKQAVDSTIQGVDATDALDRRDQILATLSEQIGVKAMKGSNNSVSLYTDGGQLLYDMSRYDSTVPVVKVSLTAGATGRNTVGLTVDNVAVTCGSNKSNDISSGRLAGLMQVHDETAPIYQAQVDEMARCLIVAFSAKDTATPGQPLTGPGLFTSSDSSVDTSDPDVLNALAAATNPTSAPVFGLAGKIVINPDIESDPTKLKLANGTDLTDMLNEKMSVYNVKTAGDLSGGAISPTTISILKFASASVSWLSQTRQSAGSENDFRSTLLQHGTDSLSKETGINVDDEMTDMLQLERAYQASSKVISVIDAMFNALLQAV
jgi:flagellar hook-associated protein 1